MGVSARYQKRRDQLQRISDAMIDLAQQHGALGGKLLETVALLAQFCFGRLLSAAHAHGVGGTGERCQQQRDELAGHVLQHIIEGAGFQRCDGDRGILFTGDDDDGRMVRYLMNELQCADTVEPRHMVVERHHIEFLPLETFDRGEAVLHRDHLDAMGIEPALNQAAEPRFVVGVKDFFWHASSQAVAGTWMTEKNRPSWRIALAKLS
jgi:hypothetical protein